MIKISKKIKILISSILVSISFISLPFKNVVEVKAIAGVDDAILIAVLGTLAVGAVGACYSVSNSGLSEKVASTIGDGISDIGSNFVEVYNGAKFAKICVDMLPCYLEACKSIEGQEYTDVSYSYIDSDGFSVVSFPFGSSVSFEVPVSKITSYWGGCGNSGSNTFIPSSSKFHTYSTHDDRYKRDYLYLTNDSNFTTYWCLNSNEIPGQCYFKFKIADGTTNIIPVSSIAVVPSVNEEINKPLSITLDKTKVEAIASDYIEEHPDDNDDKPNYSDLIPFVFDILNKELGNGEITQSNLSSNGLVSYYYEDGSTQGQYPYFFEESIINSNSNGNVTVNNNNLTVNNGNDVSEDERNGILNMLDNGLRSTTERLKSLNFSLVGFRDNISSLFSFLPDDIVSLFYLGISLAAVFFILGLRR